QIIVTAVLGDAAKQVRRLGNTQLLQMADPEKPKEGLAVRRHATEQSRSGREDLDRKSTRLNSSHVAISYAVFCLKKKKSTELILPELVLQPALHRRDPSAWAAVQVGLARGPRRLRAPRAHPDLAPRRSAPIPLRG